MADLDERTRTFLKTIPQEDSPDAGDTFAERAEWFFKKRPELLNLLKELYNGYISLKETKHQRRNSSSLTLSFDNPHHHQQQEEEEIDTNWDIESSLSNQTPDSDAGAGKSFFRSDYWVIKSWSFSSSRTGLDEFVSNLVLKNVEEEILKGQIGEMENQFQECWRKMEILKKLIQVLESERVILLSENSRLGFKVGELMEENKGLVTEVGFLKRKAAQLGRCLMKMREDQSVGMLARRVEDLQRQIDGLDQRKERGTMGGCFGAERLMRFKKRNEDGVEGGKRGRKWWEKVKKGIKFSGFGSSSSSSSCAAA